MSVVVSATVLFGGWFVYQSYAMESPLTNIVQETPGVELVTTRFTANDAEIDIKMTPGTSLREVYDHIQSEGSSILGKKELKLKVVNDSSADLDAWWSSALFDVAQAMETKHYSDIPATLKSRAGTVSDLQVSTEMNDKYVFITLTNGDKSKYVMLPRTPEKLGVWPNE
ncbi:hypothetical protein N0M98_20550 [Paenibacillus doosanensis]|uniref:hypothetical protein n=1 Tax=Paenibacillus konkukensis TaxID=2020716 RepID=UPI00201DAB56|nr:hypothetical protein [Paenibacillus konkukensis]MCS7462516.1 hypothetical protein [Paenibacillus doosanensis]